MPILNTKLPVASDSLHMKVPDTTDSVWVKFPGEAGPAKKLTAGGEEVLGVGLFLNYNVADWTLLPDASPLPVGRVESVAYNPAGTLIAVGKITAPTLDIYDSTTLTSTSGPPAPAGEVRDVVFNKTGTLMAFCSGPKVYIYNTVDWSLSRELDLPGQVEGLDFNYAGTLLAVGVGFGAAAGEYLYIYNTATWLPIAGPQPADLPEGWVYTMAFSPDDSMLAVGNHLGTTRNLSIYNTASWGLTIPTGVTTDAALELIFNNAQTELLLAKGEADYFVRWNTSTWQIIGGTPALPVQPVCIDINDDDSYVAIGLIQNATSTLLVYDASTWVLEPVPPPPNQQVIGVAFEPINPAVVCFYIESAQIGDPDPEYITICFNEQHQNCNNISDFDVFSNGELLTNRSAFDFTPTCEIHLATTITDNGPSDRDVITLNYTPGNCAKAGDPACALQPLTNYPVLNKILSVQSGNVGAISSSVVQIEMPTPMASIGTRFRVRVNDVSVGISNYAIVGNVFIQFTLSAPVTNTDVVTLDHTSTSNGALAVDGRKLHKFTGFFINNTVS